MTRMMVQRNTIKLVMTVAVLMAVFGWQPAGGQISAPGVDATRSLTYPVHPAEDPLFIFYQSYEGYRPGSLTAEGPGGGTFDFIWTQYDPSADDFTIPVKAETGVESSTIDNLDDGGYRVQVSNGVDVDTTFLAWVMLDDLVVRINKDANGEVPNVESGCPASGRYLRVVADVQTDSYSYYDPQSHQEVPLVNDYEAEWTDDNPELNIRSRTYKIELFQEDGAEMPTVDTWFVLTVTDSLGMTEQDSVFYDTKFTKAEFSVEYYDKVNNVWSSDLTTQWSKDNGSLDAPLEVRFINESENGEQFTWVLLDTTDSFADAEKMVTADFDYQPVFTYATANEFFYPYLISFSGADSVVYPDSVSYMGCPDTFLLESGIEVVASQLVIPNVFTPNGDDINDVFLFKHQSLKACRLTITDRSGKVVYRKKIENIYDWEGWRGTILNSDRKAPEGQYYYVVEGLGYDDVEYRDPNILEQRKLEREQGQTGQTGTGDEQAIQSLYTGWLYLFRQKGVY